MSLADLPAAELAGLLSRRAVRAQDIAADCLDRIAELDGTIGAWTAVDPDAVMRQAAACDAAEPRGELHGIPVGVKDLFDTADLPTAYGCHLHTGRRPAEDAAVVAAVRRAGGVVLGKTTTSEFGILRASATRHPRDPRRTPGGSSSGSAAAVAARMVPLALGTQTLGSITRPAAYCGVVGFKPTAGRWDRTGMRPISPSLDTPGVLARTVGDLDLVVRALDPSAAPSGDPSGPLRAVVVVPCGWAAAEAATVAALARAEVALGPAQDLPAAMDAADEACATIVAAELMDSLAGEADADEYIRDALAPGLRVSARALSAAHDAVVRARGALDEAFGSSDVLVTAATTGEPPLATQGTGDPRFCRLWTALGCPTVAIRAGEGPGGLPIGLQVVGRPGSDRQTIQAAGRIERDLAEISPTPLIPTSR